jgi:hypothetical protein
MISSRSALGRSHLACSRKRFASSATFLKRAALLETVPKLHCNHLVGLSWLLWVQPVSADLSGSSTTMVWTQAHLGHSKVRRSGPLGTGGDARQHHAALLALRTTGSLCRQNRRFGTKVRAGHVMRPFR